MQEPSWLTVVSLELAVGTFLRGYYRSYIESLPVRGDERLLEFGAGTGHAARWLSLRLEKGGSVTCLDISKRWTNRAQRRTRDRKNVKHILGTIDSVDLTPDSFDIVFAHYVLHELPPRQRSTTFVYFSVYLRKGGKLFLREPHSPGHGISAAELRRLAANAGFREAGMRQDSRSTSCVFVRV